MNNVKILTLITCMVFAFLSCTNKNNKQQGNDNINTSVEDTIPPKRNLVKDSTYILDEGKMFKYCGFDGVNEVLETNVRFSQEDMNNFFLEYNMSDTERLQLTLQEGESSATYAYVEDGFVNYEDDAPETKEDVKDVAYNNDIDDLDHDIDIIPPIQMDGDYEFAVANFREVASEFNNFSSKYGQTKDYKRLKKKFYDAQKRILGKVVVKGI